MIETLIIFLKGIKRISYFISILILINCSPAITKAGQETDSSSGEITSNISEGSEKQDSASHGDKLADIYLILFVIITGAVLGRKFIARKLNQPEVLGELIIGVLIGLILYQLNNPMMMLIRHKDDVNKIIESNVNDNLTWKESIEKNIPKEEFSKGGYGKELERILTNPGFQDNNKMVNAIFIFSGLGVLILLFMVGLETSIDEMFEVGKTSVIVAILGVIFPLIFGYITSMLLLPGHSPNLYLFIGATLCATSISITARVFKDMKKLNIPESKTILGAAVIDDVLGLIVLAVIAGIIESGEIRVTDVAIITIKAVMFLGITFIIGKKYLMKPIRFAMFIDKKNVSLLFPFGLMILLSWISEAIGLASIVGAFAAGLIIKEEFFTDVQKGNSKPVKSVIEPIEAIFAPVFFVIMGMQVDLNAFLNTEVTLIAAALTIVAILGKMLSSIFVKKMDKKIIGIGMIPRGEVGLIFAGIGKAIGVLDSSMFSAIIVVIILTTFITPPLLKLAFSNYDKKHRQRVHA